MTPCNNNNISRTQISLRRRTLQNASRIAFLSSLIIVASSTTNEPVIVPTTSKESNERQQQQLGRECASSPRVVNFNFLPTQQPLLPKFSPRDTPQLGDGQRSTEASGLFFDSIDRDGDGQIEPEEVAIFLKDQIGELETQQAVDSEVVTVMEKLDQNRDNGLEMADMHEYWMQLETLLTAEEVAEWIVYAVQLPSSVGKIFMEHSVTGYDFLEIVENGGKILSDELGINKSSFRNKIVKNMQTRMLGIGGLPSTPTKFDFKIQSCNAVSLSWEKSTARVFPVHSYRVQRRGVNLFGNTQTQENDSILATNNGNEFLFSSNSDWRTVFVGSGNDFVDSGLDTGHNYMYRIQAWNSVGKSGWETIDLSRALKKQRCSTKRNQKVATAESVSPRSRHTSPEEEEEVPSWLSLPKRVVWGIIFVIQFVYHFIRGIFGVIAMGAAIMRFRRASASSSSAASIVLPFVSFWEKVNKLSVKWTGKEFIPKTMLGDRKSIELQEQLHDERIMATGLRGYDRIRKKSKNEENAGTNGNSVLKEGSKNRTTSRSSDDLSSPLPKEVVVSRGRGAASPLTQTMFTWKRGHRTTSLSLDTHRSYEVSTDSEADSSERNNSSSKGSGKVPKTAPKLSSRHSTDIDDGNRCIECKKKFQFAKRYKHHCSRCMATFCHKHGYTTHPNIVSCKVPGTCLCNPCLAVLREKGVQSER